MALIVSMGGVETLQVGDLIANLTVARMASPMMAICACYAGPLFNLLVALGMPMGIVAYRTGPIPVRVTLLMYWLIWSHVCLLVVMLVYVPWCGWKINRQLCYALMAAYAGIIMGTLVLDSAQG